MNNDLKWSSYDFSKIPFDKIKSFGQRTLLEMDLFNVSWILNRHCNFFCSYCWEYAHTKEKDFRPLPLITKTIDEIIRQAKENNFNSFHFSFSGGEPTTHPNYLDIIKHYVSHLPNLNYQSLHMTTNMSKNIKWLKEYVNITKDLHRVSITASFHSEFAKKEKFIEKLLFCQENDIQVTINMVMRPELFEYDWENAIYFHEKGINTTLKPQSNYNATKIVEGYTDDMLKRLYNGMPQRDFTAAKLKENNKESIRPKYKKLKQITSEENIPQIMQVELTDNENKKWYLDQAERFNAFEFNNFENWKCNAGYQSIIIREPDGNIKRGYSCGDKPLGNIETGFKLFDKPTICISKSCVSSADSKIPKKR